jgi:hypothetical protein
VIVKCELFLWLILDRVTIYWMDDDIFRLTICFWVQPRTYFWNYLKSLNSLLKH